MVAPHFLPEPGDDDYDDTQRRERLKEEDGNVSPVVPREADIRALVLTSCVGRGASGVAFLSELRGKAYVVKLPRALLQPPSIIKEALAGGVRIEDAFAASTTYTQRRAACGVFAKECASAVCFIEPPKVWSNTSKSQKYG